MLIYISSLQPGGITISEQINVRTGTGARGQDFTSLWPTKHLSLYAFDDIDRLIFYFTELFCNGEWSSWFNTNTPSIQDKGDYELLEELPPMCPYKISDINCEAIKFPQQPINKTQDIVTCDRTKGLICNYTDQSPKDRLMCLDYRIRVCCERKQSTTTIIPTIYETPSKNVTYSPPESCVCNSYPRRKVRKSHTILKKMIICEALSIIKEI